MQNLRVYLTTGNHCPDKFPDKHFLILNIKFDGQIISLSGNDRIIHDLGKNGIRGIINGWEEVLKPQNGQEFFDAIREAYSHNKYFILKMDSEPNP